MKTMVVAAALIIWGSGQALAADVAASEIAPAGFVWSGGYVGLQAGYGWGDTRFDDDAYRPSQPMDIGGLTAGVTIGYNYQFHPNWVAGVEADFSWSGIDGREADIGGSWGCDDACSTEIEWYGTARVRLGYAIDRLLVFGTGGLAVGRVHGELEGAGPVWDNEHTNVGWAAGAGVEYAFTQNWTAKLEYMHIDLGWTDRTGPAEFTTDADFDALRFGINYKF
ncbi:outer membrane protein [Aminobacter sp. UC22_36]|uniref:outer membrane protein n=1 Tax=Aminobacter sp. UC22_36 TaxID=3374549 RepID=UPI003756E304